jgi:hypothetical protein
VLVERLFLPVQINATMLWRTSTIVMLMLKSFIYFSLATVFYIYNLTEVLHKYEEGNTNIANSEEKIENGIRPPFMTLCSGPRAKQSVLNKYNVTVATLNEPNPHDIEMLTKMNKTVEELFIEATFKLNVDFQLHMTWWLYNNNGWVKQGMLSLPGTILLYGLYLFSPRIYTSFYF